MPTTGRPPRLAAGAFAVLVLATAAAFFLANQLKSQPPEIEVVRRDEFFSPNGDGRRDTEAIVFSVDLSGAAAVDIVDADGARVRRLTDRLRLRPGGQAKVVWDGRDDDGRRAPDGEYRMRLNLAEGRSLLAPRPFFADTVAPRPSVTVDEDSPIVRPGTAVPFRVSGAGEDLAPRFRVLRTDVSPPRVVRRIAGEKGKESYSWDGRTDAGAVAGPGTYLVAATAFDKARNRGVGPPLPLAPGGVDGRPGVTVRSLAVQPPVRSVRAGDPFVVRVDARERAYRWTLRRLGVGKPVQSGRKAAGRTSLLLRAPRGPSGVYLLEVRSHGSTSRAPVAVRARSRVGPLVVLPMITWLGRDPVDQTGDGVPDVFGSGSTVRFPRPFAFRGGLPPGLASDVAPLLVSLDRLGLRYDLATDLDLVFGTAPQAGQKGVLIPAGAEWISRQLARRLRGYVTGGGRLALFGPRALRASVTVGDGVLVRPSPVTTVDALGGRIGPVRALASGTSLSVLQEEAGLGLLEGFAGELGGFDEVEELLSPGDGEVRTAVGVETAQLRPALSATALGNGLVIRVGLPGWGERLEAGDGSVEQLTANIADLLRGVQPRARTARR